MQEQKFRKVHVRTKIQKSECKNKKKFRKVHVRTKIQKSECKNKNSEK